MQVLPIVERELRVATRRRGTYRVRFWVPLILLIAASWFRLGAGVLSAHEMGAGLFYLATGGLTLFALVAGYRATADCLSVEKREGTLGLLFLTDLRGYDVVLGKLLAHSVVLFYALLAVVPLLGIPLLLGGVTGGEYVRQTLVFLNALFFSLSAGMLASVWCQRAATAASVGLGLILLVTGVPPFLGWLELHSPLTNGSYRLIFLLPCPVFTYLAGMASAYSQSLGNLFYPSLAITHAFGWLFLILAGVKLQRSWRTTAEGKMKFPLAARGRSEPGSRRGRKVNRHRGLLDKNAYSWLVLRQRRGVNGFWLVYALFGAFWIGGLYELRQDWLHPVSYMMTVWALLASFKAMVSNEVGQRLWGDRKSGAIELLLVTPLSVAEIIAGERQALCRRFRNSFLLLLSTVVPLLGACWYRHDLDFSGQISMLSIQLVVVGIFVPDLLALFWLGLWKSVATPTTRRDFRLAASSILTLPWLLMLIFLPFAQMFPSPLPAVAGWFGISLFIDVAWINYAKNEIHEEFRAAAAERFAPSRPR
ncbi:MAG: ABC transporter permease [Verrucomicrobiae bacterium]|nr:ABC transporter permease [Verrucomicrobiae bacterium]